MGLCESFKGEENDWWDGQVGFFPKYHVGFDFTSGLNSWSVVPDDGPSLEYMDRVRTTILSLGDLILEGKIPRGVTII